MPNGENEKPQDSDEEARLRSAAAADRAWEQAQREAQQQREAAERNEN